MAGPQVGLACHALCGMGELLPGERPGPVAGGQSSFPRLVLGSCVAMDSWASNKGARPFGFHPDTLGYGPGLQARL